MKGKILKIRMGHEANCSSAMFLVLMLYAGAATYLPTGMITAGLQAHQARSDGEVNKNTNRSAQIIGLIITCGLFIFGVTIGNGGFSLGLSAVVFGAGYALAVYLGSKLASKISYLNILAVPIIQIALIFVGCWLVLFFLY